MDDRREHNYPNYYLTLSTPTPAPTETDSPLDMIEVTYTSPYGIEETYEEVKYVLGMGVWMAGVEEEGERYWGVKAFSEGQIEFEITMNENDQVEVHLKGPRIICTEVESAIEEMGE